MPALPRDVINVGVGDCKDKAVLLASLINSIGGSARVVVYMPAGDEDGHAFVELRLNDNPEDKDAVSSFIQSVVERYSVSKDKRFCVRYAPDATWVVLDAASKENFPGFAGRFCTSDKQTIFIEKPR